LQGGKKQRKSCAKKKVSVAYANFFSYLSKVIKALHVQTSASRNAVANHCKSALNSEQHHSARR